MPVAGLPTIVLSRLYLRTTALSLPGPMMVSIFPYNNGESWTAVNSGLKDSINVCCLKIRNDAMSLQGRGVVFIVPLIRVRVGLRSILALRVHMSVCLAASDSVVFAGTFSGGCLPIH